MLCHIVSFSVAVSELCRAVPCRAVPCRAVPCCVGLSKSFHLVIAMPCTYETCLAMDVRNKSCNIMPRRVLTGRTIPWPVLRLQNIPYTCRVMLQGTIPCPCRVVL